MTDALLVIDVQNDFCPGGALAVADGDQIVPSINALMGSVFLSDSDSGLAPNWPFFFRQHHRRGAYVHD